VTDVVFSDIIINSHLFSDVWWGKAEPIYVTAYRRANGNNKDANWRFPKGKTEGSVGNVSNIYFSNIKGVSENGIYVGAESADKISGVVFDQVDLMINKSTNIIGGIYDRRPAKVDGLLSAGTSGFYLDAATGITIRNSSVNWGDNRPAYFKHVLESHGVNNLKTINLDGEAAFPDKTQAVIKY
jgi:hypothetical protein